VSRNRILEVADGRDRRSGADTENHLLCPKPARHRAPRRQSSRAHAPRSYEELTISP